MNRKENRTTPPAAIGPDQPRSLLRLCGVALSVGLFVLPFTLLLTSATGTIKVASSLPRPLLSDSIEGDCNEPGNLAPNPSFECDGVPPTLPADWVYDTFQGNPAIFYRSQQLFKSGDYSVFIGSGSAGSISRWRSKPIVAREGRVYEFSVYANAGNLSDEATVTLTFWAGLPHEAPWLKVVDAEGTGDTSGQWVHLAKTFTAPPGTRYIRLECRLYGAGTVWFDDAAIREYIEEPVLELTQIATPETVPGATLMYTLVLSNTGNTTATNVVITDTLDANVLFIESVPPPVGGSGQTRFWHVGSLPVDGAHQIVITTAVKSPLPDYTSLNNRVEWRSDQTDIQENLEQTLVRSVPILTVAKTDTHDPVTAGRFLTYTIKITNSGTATMTGIVLTEIYPSHTIFTTASHFSYNPPTNTVWLIDELAPSKTQSVTIILSTTSSITGTILNRALIDSNETEEIYVTEMTDISGTSPLSPSMWFVPESVTITVKPGESFQYHFTLINKGTPQQDIDITLNIPEKWQGSAWVDPENINLLRIKDEKTVFFGGRSDINQKSGEYTFQIIAASEQITASATAVVIVKKQPDVRIEPDHNCDVYPGHRVTFTHWISNLGNFTDTILVNASWYTNPGDFADTILIDAPPFTQEPVAPPVTLTNVGIGSVYPVTVMIDVFDEAQMNREGIVIVSATSTMTVDQPYDSALNAAIVRRREVFLPIVTKRLSLPDPFCNGDFAAELEPCWDDITPPVERICSSNDCFVRLGSAEEDNNCEGNLTPGTAELAQTFVPTITGDARLSFEYLVHTQDVLWDIYDTLEAYVGTTRVLLVVHPHDPYGCLYDPLIVTGTHRSQPISVVGGVPTTVRFRLVNGDTWHNTYAEIRNVKVTYEP